MNVPENINVSEYITPRIWIERDLNATAFDPAQPVITVHYNQRRQFIVAFVFREGDLYKIDNGFDASIISLADNIPLVVHAADCQCEWCK